MKIEQDRKAASEPPLDWLVMCDTPQVDALIAKVMADFPAHTTATEARYYNEVHQHLAPLARGLERENSRLRAALVAHNVELTGARKASALNAGLGVTTKKG